MKNFNRYFLFHLALVTILTLGFVGQASANLILSDSFSGTTIDSSKWITNARIGSFAFTQNNGLYYSANSENWSSIRANNTFSGDFETVLSFSDFSTTSTRPAGYTGLTSALVLAIGVPDNQVLLNYNGSYFATLRFNAVTLERWGMITGPSTVIEGLLKLSSVGGTVSASYDIGSGWTSLGSFTPGWTGPVSLFIAGANLPDGQTSFKVNSISVTATPIPGAIFLFAPGLAGLVAVRRRGRKFLEA